MLWSICGTHPFFLFDILNPHYRDRISISRPDRNHNRSAAFQFFSVRTVFEDISSLNHRQYFITFPLKCKTKRTKFTSEMSFHTFFKVDYVFSYMDRLFFQFVFNLRFTFQKSLIGLLWQGHEHGRGHALPYKVITPFSKTRVHDDVVISREPIKKRGVISILCRSLIVKNASYRVSEIHLIKLTHFNCVFFSSNRLIDDRVRAEKKLLKIFIFFQMDSCTDTEEAKQCENKSLKPINRWMIRHNY